MILIKVGSLLFGCGRVDVESSIFFQRSVHACQQWGRSPTHCALVWQHSWKCVTAVVSWFACTLKRSPFDKGHRIHSSPVNSDSDKHAEPTGAQRTISFVGKLSVSWGSARRMRIMENARESQKHRGSSHLEFHRKLPCAPPPFFPDWLLGL